MREFKRAQRSPIQKKENKDLSMSEILVMSSTYARPPVFFLGLRLENSVGYGSETLTLRFVLTQNEPFRSC